MSGTPNPNRGFTADMQAGAAAESLHGGPSISPARKDSSRTIQEVLLGTSPIPSRPARDSPSQAPDIACSPMQATPANHRTAARSPLRSPNKATNTAVPGLPGAPQTPTRNLFRLRSDGSGVSKRDADSAHLSPKKVKIKSAKTTPVLPPSKDVENMAGLPHHSSPPFEFPSGSSSSEAKRPVFDRSMEIKGSDDEDSDSLSDSSLPDIDFLIPTLPQIEPTLPSPKAKRSTRRAAKLTPSRRAKSRFDMKTLLEHQRSDDAVKASAVRLEEADAKVKADEAGPDLEDSINLTPGTTRRRFIDIAGVKDDEVAAKAMRAMQRTEAATAVRDRWYFFEAGPIQSKQPPNPFPTKTAQGPWSLLVKERTRGVNLRSPVMRTVMGRCPLPDDIFDWALTDMTSNNANQAVTDGWQLVTKAQPTQIQRLVTPQRLQEHLRRLGATDHINDDKLRPVSAISGAYVNRDWTSLKIFLLLLAKIARHLEFASVVHSFNMLLRMAADEMLVSHSDIRVAHQHALLQLAETVEPSRWDDFCGRTCRSLYLAFEQNFLRLPAVLSLGGNSNSMRDLRRRFARAFFFENPSLAQQHPDHESVVRLAIGRLKVKTFEISRQTNYLELKAQIHLLDIAIADGSFRPDGENPNKEKSFNASVDDLAQRLKRLWSGINDTGAAFLSRTEAKSALDGAQKRLTYNIRTKPPPKLSLYDGVDQREDKFTQTRIDFKRFLKRPDLDDTRGSASPQANHDDSLIDDDTFVTARGD